MAALDPLHPEEVGLDLEGEGVSLRRLVEAASRLVRTLEALDRSVVGRSRVTLDWVLTGLSGGSAHLVARARPLSSNAPIWAGRQVVRTLQQGVDRMRAGRELPPHFPIEAKESLLELVRLTGRRGVTAVRLRTAGGEMRLDEAFSHAVNITDATRQESYGSAEGIIEMMTTHTQNYFNLYDDLTGEPVRCYFPEEMFGAVHDSFRRRVQVVGLVTRGIDGRKESIRIDEIHVFPLDEELPSADDVIGMLNA